MKLIRLIASPILMYVLAGVYALVLAIATFVENSSGPALARDVYKRQTLLPPYFAGSNKSNLIKRLEEGHGGTKLTPQEIRKVSLWIDLLVPQIGDYREANNWSDHDREFYDRYDKKMCIRDRVNTKHDKPFTLAKLSLEEKK